MTLTYQAAHKRVRAAKGKPWDYLCVDCQQRAQCWTYAHDCPAERTNDMGKLPFCEHVWHYEPRCQGCHRRYDKKAA